MTKPVGRRKRPCLNEEARVGNDGDPTCQKQARLVALINPRLIQSISRRESDFLFQNSSECDPTLAEKWRHEYHKFNWQPASSTLRDRLNRDYVAVRRYRSSDMGGKARQKFDSEWKRFCHGEITPYLAVTLWDPRSLKRWLSEPSKKRSRLLVKPIRGPTVIT